MSLEIPFVSSSAHLPLSLNHECNPAAVTYIDWIHAHTPNIKY